MRFQPVVFTGASSVETLLSTEVDDVSTDCFGAGGADAALDAGEVTGGATVVVEPSVVVVVTGASVVVVVGASIVVVDVGASVVVVVGSVVVVVVVDVVVVVVVVVVGFSHSPK